jgi:hypothetical protein
MTEWIVIRDTVYPIDHEDDRWAARLGACQAEGEQPMTRTTLPALRVLNWGLGQDSTTIALLAEHGEIPPFDAIIWADTQQEPQEVYETIEWVMPLLTPPVYRVTAGDLGAAILSSSMYDSDKTRWTIGQPPFWVKTPSDTPGASLHRACTRDYKVLPIRRKIRELLGLRPGQHVPKDTVVHQSLGFPLDELGRTYCSPYPWLVNTFPLIDLRMRKHDCARWLAQHRYPIPPKSSCTFCPYHSNAYWRRMRDTQPAEWTKTIAFEAALHQGKLPGVRGTPYVHKSMVPLPLAPIDEPETGQQELFCFACNT